MKDELLDLVNQDDKVIGKVWKRKAHQDPSLIHREVAIAIFNKKHEVLLQRRSMSKTNDPGHWKITAAGHVGADENPKDSIKREVFEELGLNVQPIYYKKAFSTYKNKESRYFWIYYAIVDTPQKLKLNKQEVMDAKWVKVGKLEEFSKSSRYSLKGLSHKTILELKKLLKL